MPCFYILYKMLNKMFYKMLDIMFDKLLNNMFFDSHFEKRFSFCFLQGSIKPMLYLFF